MPGQRGKPASAVLLGRGGKRVAHLQARSVLLIVRAGAYARAGSAGLYGVVRERKVPQRTPGPLQAVALVATFARLSLKANALCPSVLSVCTRDSQRQYVISVGRAVSNGSLDTAGLLGRWAMAASRAVAVLVPQLGWWNNGPNGSPSALSPAIREWDGSLGPEERPPQRWHTATAIEFSPQSGSRQDRFG